MIGKRPTIIDVAKVAGVSKSTVSLVLQDNPSVKSKTRDQVLAAIEDTGYVYHRAAANLRSNKTGMIGLVINNLNNPFYTEFSVSIQMALSQYDYVTVIANSDGNSQLQHQIILSMISHSVDSLIIAPCYGDSRKTFDMIKNTNIPTLQLLRKVDARTSLFPFVSMDYKSGSYRATEHLLAKGAKNIAFVGGIASQSVTQERLSGYLKKMQEKNLTPQVFYGRSSRRFGYHSALKIAEKKLDIDAVIAFNDIIALGMINGFSHAGIGVGRDILLIGFDDIREASQSYPNLTTVGCDIRQFGKDIASLIHQWSVYHKKIPPITHYPVDIIIRESG